MTARVRISTTKRVKLLTDHGEACATCGISLHLQPWHLDHRIPLSMGGADDASNWQPLCHACHLEKTKEEAPTRAKAIRLDAAHKGAKAPPVRKLQSRGFAKSQPKRTATAPLNKPAAWREG
jgi:5-methylcytosine-specific restriction enzyme A